MVLYDYALSPSLRKIDSYIIIMNRDMDEFLLNVTEIIPQKVFFGAYPDKSILEYVKSVGIDTVVDLTTPREIKKADQYNTENFNYIKYSIRDCKAPTDVTTFRALIDDLVGTYKKGGKIYCHCRGGHGRSGLLAIVLLKEIKGYDVQQAIKIVKDKHQLRSSLSVKAKRLGIPQTKIQRQFLKDYYDTQVLFYNSTRLYHEFSNFYLSKITIDGIEYPTVEHYYQSMKYQNHPQYQELIRTQNTPGKAFYLGRRIKRYQYKWMLILNDLIDGNSSIIDPEWLKEDNKLKIKVMLTGLREKFSQNPKLKELLLSTGVKKIHEDSPRDSYWGLGKDSKGDSMLGILLMQIRDELRPKVENIVSGKTTVATKKENYVIEHVQYDMTFPDDVKESLGIVDKRLRRIVLALALKAKDNVKKNRKEGGEWSFNMLNSKLDDILKGYKHSDTSFLFRHLELLLAYFDATVGPWDQNSTT